MISAALALALLMADPTPDAGSPPAAAPAATPKVKVNRDGMVCHTEEVLGSRIPKKVCMSPAEAEDRARQDQQNLNHMQSQNGFVHQ